MSAQFIAASRRCTLRLGQHGTGMTLIEVLVTLVIISVGLLGVAAMQLTTVRNNYDAFVRSQAAVLAGDMLDRVRANRTVALTYNVAIDASATGGTVAANDMNAWKTTLAAQLPSGRGAVSALNATVPGGLPIVIITVRVQWGERGETAPLEFVTSSEI